MPYIKLIHNIAVFIWIGNLLSLTRLMGYHVKEDRATQLQMAKIYKRMYSLVQLPTMITAVLCGIILSTTLNHSDNQTWFMVKILFVTGLIICDLACGRFVKELNVEPDLSRGVKYKILHGVTGLLLIGTLIALYIFK